MVDNCINSDDIHAVDSNSGSPKKETDKDYAPKKSTESYKL